MYKQITIQTRKSKKNSYLESTFGQLAETCLS